MRRMRDYSKIPDPMAALQHEIRDAAHDTGGLYAYLDGIASLAEKGIYDLEETIAHVRGAAERAAILNAQFNRRKQEGKAACARLDANSVLLKELRTARMARQGRNPDGVYLKCTQCHRDLHGYRSQVHPPICRYCDPEAETE